MPRPKNLPPVGKYKDRRPGVYLYTARHCCHRGDRFAQAAGGRAGGSSATRTPPPQAEAEPRGGWWKILLKVPDTFDRKICRKGLTPLPENPGKVPGTIVRIFS